MSIQQLKDVLELVEPKREIWSTPGGQTVRAGDIKRFLAGSNTLFEQLRNRSVAVLEKSEDRLAPLLVLLDGTCQQITLLPPALSPDRLASIVSRSGADILVTTETQVELPIDIEVCPFEWNPTGGGENDSLDTQDTPFMPTRWVLPTSGTTGEPKLVCHTLASLTRTTKHDLDRGKAYCWGSLYNLTGFAGLQVFLQSWCGGSRMILGRHDATLQERVAELEAAGCSALSATPTMWRKLLMTYAVDKLPLKRITLGGEIVDQNILDALRRTFPDATIIHIYASTEAGVGFAVKDRRAGFPVSFVDTPPPGVRIAIDEHNRLLLGTDCNEQEYLGNGEPLRRDDGLIDTGDSLTKKGDRFLFLGRADGTINVGGNKVHPEEIESFLVGCGGVRLARVGSRKSSFTGSLVEAEVVAEASDARDADELRTSLLTLCRRDLEPYKVPAILRVVDSIELTTSGKIKRIA